jgi:hypothetical protein
MLVVCAAALLWTGIVPGATWELTASYARLQNRPSATALPAPPAAPEAAPPVPSALVGPVDRRRANP